MNIAILVYFKWESPQVLLKVQNSLSKGILLNEWIEGEVKAFIWWLFRKAKEYVDDLIIHVTESKTSISWTDQFSKGKD